MGGIVAREVVRDLDRLQHPARADQLLELGAFVRAMQAGRDQHLDPSRGEAGVQQLLSSGGRNRPFGTGRVMSQIRMQALFAPRASSASGGVPTGAASASAPRRQGPAAPASDACG